MVGYFWMKADTGTAAKYITSIAISTAAIMISTSCASPIAVMIELSEKTRSIDDELRQHEHERALATGFRLLVLRLDLGMDFARAFGNQEQTAANQDQVAPGEFVAEDGEDRRGQPHDPGQRQQQRDAEHESECEADAPRELSLPRRQACDQDTDEDDIVDAENDFQHRQCHQRRPGARIGQVIAA